MGSLSMEEQSKWRSQIINAVKFGDYHYEKNPVFFNPVNYYNFEERQHKTEKEIVRFDLNAVRNSDLIIVNFNDPNSLGTCAELAIAYNMHIPIIGINKDGVELHPWLVEFTTRMCDDIREAVSHVVDFYLN
jgi:nucleoside 2-deoxyribosyltransferase